MLDDGQSPNKEAIHYLPLYSFPGVDTDKFSFSALSQKNLVMDVVLLPDIGRVMEWLAAARSPTVKQRPLAFVNFVFHLNYIIACFSFNMVYIH